MYKNNYFHKELNHQYQNINKCIQTLRGYFQPLWRYDLLSLGTQCSKQRAVYIKLTHIWLYMTRSRAQNRRNPSSRKYDDEVKLKGMLRVLSH